MKELQIFNNEEFGQVRTTEINGTPYFMASDIAKALGYAKPNDAVKQHCRATVKHSTPVSGKMQAVNFISEGDMYRLITHSKLELAERFESWVFDEVLPSLRKTGSYETQNSKAHAERLASVNNAVKILTPMLEKAGCNSRIQLLTAKTLYEKAGVIIPIEIQADKRYWDTVHIAREAGIYYKSSGKPSDKAVNEIIRRIVVSEEDYTETWEAKGNWQGTVRKYCDDVIDQVKCWIADNDYPVDIEYQQTDGRTKAYHVSYKDREVA